MKRTSSIALLIFLAVMSTIAPASANDLPNLSSADSSTDLVADDYDVTEEVPGPLGSDLRACFQKLSRGENYYRTQIPLAALERIEAGYKRWPGYTKNRRYAMLIDYTRNSRDRRAFLIDFQACEVVASEFVIHGGTTYHPLNYFGDPNRDGFLDYCRQPSGSRQFMTRPGVYVTRGCHQSNLQGWPQIYKDCEGIKLEGLEASNRDAFRAGVVLHEHVAISNDDSMKLEGQGCPTMPPGALSPLVPYGLMRGALVLMYAPQCKD